MPSMNDSRLPTSGRWSLRTQTIEFSERPVVMGIVNVTPDSFSDGGKFYTPDLAIEQALRLQDEGAGIIDIGGESTRPYSEPVGEDEELRRVEPVLKALVDRLSIPISIDTTKSSVARMAIDLGAEIINDISGLEADPEMQVFAAECGAGICAMHMQGTPQTMQDNPSYENVTGDILNYLLCRDKALLEAGIAPEKICLDPGIGFGKTHEHNLELLKNAERFHEAGRPILIGHSRKGFVGKIIGDKSADRDFGTLGISLALAVKGIQVLRVHNVKATCQALAGFEACRCLP